MGKPKPEKQKPPKAPKRKRSPRERLGYWLLVLGTVLGIAAGVSYAVPIPGLTAVSAAETPPKKTPAPEPNADLIAKEQAEAELQAREQRLQENEAKVADLLKDLTLQKLDSDPARRAADMYGNMPPYKAGPLMENLDDAMAVQVLKLLDEDQAAAIIMYMDSTRGAELMSELVKAASARD